MLYDLNQAARYCDWLVVLKAGELKYVGASIEVMTEQMLPHVFKVNGKVIADPISNPLMAVYA